MTITSRSATVPTRIGRGLRHHLRLLSRYVRVNPQDAGGGARLRAGGHRRVPGAASREGRSGGLRECGGRWWGGARRRGGTGAGEVGEVSHFR
jgi:hypothetical protein